MFDFLRRKIVLTFPRCPGRLNLGRLAWLPDDTQHLVEIGRNKIRAFMATRPGSRKAKL